MEPKQTCLELRLGSTRIRFKGDAALLNGGVLDVAAGLDRLQVPKVADAAANLSRDLEATRALQEEVRQALDSMAEMGEMESLRLQMAMDRISSMMAMLSNLLKKSSDTAAAIVQNLR